jgi:hypothetical protein
VSASNPVPLWRRTLVGLAGIAGGLVLAFGAPGAISALCIPVIALFVAGFVIHLPSLGPQLLARAIWWANLGLGAIICLLDGRSSASPALGLTMLCAFALLAAGRQGLGEAGEREGYAPSAFRSSLLLLMVLALADAQTFLLFVVLARRESEPSGVTLLLLPAMVAYIVGFVGLYRLQVWGAVLNALTSAIVFVVALSQVTHLDRELRGVILVLTGVHALAAAPMLFSLFSGRRLPQASPRVRSLLGSGVVLAIVLVSTLSVWGLVRLW